MHCSLPCRNKLSLLLLVNPRDTKMRIISVVFISAYLLTLPHTTWCLPPMLRTVMLSDSIPIYNLKPFPENTLCLHVNVTHTTHPSSCHWIINETQAVQHRDYIPYADGSSLVLQPFGQHFHYTYCTCLVIQTNRAYTVYIGGPGKWFLGSREMEMDVSFNKINLLFYNTWCEVDEYISTIMHTAFCFARMESGNPM